MFDACSRCSSYDAMLSIFRTVLQLHTQPWMYEYNIYMLLSLFFFINFSFQLILFSLKLFFHLLQVRICVSSLLWCWVNKFLRIWATRGLRQPLYMCENLIIIWFVVCSLLVMWRNQSPSTIQSSAISALCLCFCRKLPTLDNSGSIIRSAARPDAWPQLLFPTNWVKCSLTFTNPDIKSR